MLEKILEYERVPFFWMNGSDSPLLDHFMWLVSNKLVWIPWIICILFVLFYKKNWKEALLVVFAIALVILIADQVSSGLFKPLFHRFRPTYHPDFMDQVKTVFNYRGGRYGFVSSHAANAFGVAMFTTLLFKNRFFTFTAYLFALLNIYSRIYLGVHFISDVVAGALIGLLAGWIVFLLYNLFRRYVFKIPVSGLSHPIYHSKEINIVSYGFWAILFLLLVLNNQLVNILL